VTWTSFENLTDTAAGTFNMGTGGSVSGNVTAVGGTVSYVSYATPATFNLNGGASTGMAASSGVTSVTGSAGSDTITGTGQTYTVTGSNAGNNGTVSWTSFENLTDLSTGTLRATTATWTLNGPNTGSVTNLSGAFAGMGNLTDLGTGTFNMHGSGNGSVSGNLSGGTNGTMNYAGYTSPVTLSLSGAAGTTTGVGGARAGITSVTGSSNSDTITGSGATYNLTAQNAGTSGGLSWASFENISDAAGGTFNLAVASNNVTGTISSGGTGATLNSSGDITALNLSVPSTLTMTGSASTWNLTGAPQPGLFQTTNANANVYFNGACIGGPACGTVITIVGSISSTVSQIASQALKDAQSTDSVAKQIDYGFAGDVGTTPPMDHRIDETGISTPDCLEESREARPCKN
jgi:fibronectin-binding autotransporter adhesin